MGHPLDGEYVVYEDTCVGRCYWQGPGRSWRSGDVGRASAVRFPDMLVARAALAASRRQRRRIRWVGYEWLPPTVQQLELITQVGEETA